MGGWPRSRDIPKPQKGGRTAPVPVRSPVHAEGAPGPSLLGTWESTKAQESRITPKNAVPLTDSMTLRSIPDPEAGALDRTPICTRYTYTWPQIGSKKGAKTIKNGAKTINFELFYALYVGFQPDPPRFFVPLEQDVLATSHAALPFVSFEAGIFLLFIGL